jgi:calcineurin-like phosphoesterase family protein
MTDFFTSDWHFFHRNIIRYCNRPFKDEREMREEIIKRHNEVVKPEDTIYILGDVGMLGRDRLSKLRPILKKMNGTKHLILGNHDEGKPFTYERMGFTTVHTALIYDTERNIILRHDPAACVVSPESLWLVGHVHNLFKVITDPIVCYNVGVDVNNFYPVTLDHIMSEIEAAGGQTPTLENL